MSVTGSGSSRDSGALFVALFLVLCAALARHGRGKWESPLSAAPPPPHAGRPLSSESAAWVGDMCAGHAIVAALPSDVAAAGGDAPAAAKKEDVASAFTSIYASFRWGGEGEGSGAGSSLRATAGTRDLIELLIWRHHVTRLVDAPCGSAHWMPPLLARVRAWAPCFSYVGLDVVESVVAANVQKFAATPGVSFAVADLSAAPLPAAAAAPDMILCRDALQHLPLLYVIDVLENFARARPRVLAVGSYVEAAARGNPNAEIARVGDYFHISLAHPPFNMSDAAFRAAGSPHAGEPMDVLDERTPHSDDKEHKYILVYSGEYLAQLDFAAMRASAVRDFGAVARQPRRAQQHLLASSAPAPVRAR